MERIKLIKKDNLLAIDIYVLLKPQEFSKIGLFALLSLLTQLNSSVENSIYMSKTIQI